jgi:Uma2 family endonuclease
MQANTKAERSSPKILESTELIRRVGDVPLDRIRWNPPIGTAKQADVVRLLNSNDKQACELVNGVLVAKPLSFKKSVLNAYLIASIMTYLSTDETDTGIVLSPWMPIRIRRGRIRIPDAMYISWDRLPSRGNPDILNVIPELVVDFILAANTVNEMEIKLNDYFDANVRLVWYVDPKTETIAVYTSPDAKTTLTINDTLDGGDVLPGFSLPLKKLFRRIERRSKKKR